MIARVRAYITKLLSCGDLVCVACGEEMTEQTFCSLCSCPCHEECGITVDDYDIVCPLCIEVEDDDEDN